MDCVGSPLQIVSTGEADGNEFVLEEANVEAILSKIPADTKVAVLSIVGAFRSGKSFLLTFFLRYLRYGCPEDLSESWMTACGESIAEGNMNGSRMETDSESSLKSNGFAWSGGHDRQTTGIWMWSEPFIRKVATHPEPIAILLMDTQGMFDNEATMALTARIFGLSTLISSYQIYNVDKRIQEDNLQHLALFSEYGRLALGEEKPDKKSNTIPSEVLETSVEETDGVKSKLSPPSTKKTAGGKVDRQKPVKKPFQRMEFLVRDWQNFDHDWEEAVQEGICEEKLFQEYHDEMKKYFSGVIKDRNAGDLQITRDQIAKCFEKVGCFLLPHPGFSVVKKTYKGEIDKIEPSFRGLLNQYVRLVFDGVLEPKIMAERSITGKELLTFIKAYSLMFQDGDSSFPKAMTMLEATAEANNRNAFDMAIQKYKTKMDSVAGPQSAFIKESHLNAIHNELLSTSLEIFEDIVGIGTESAIEKIREKLITEIESERQRYFDANANRNPFKNVEFYALPLLLASVSWIIAVVIDSSCSTDLCESAEDGFQNIYLFIFLGFIFIAWRHIAGSWDHLKTVLPMLLSSRIGNIKGEKSD